MQSVYICLDCRIAITHARQSISLPWRHSKAAFATLRSRASIRHGDFNKAGQNQTRKDQKRHRDARFNNATAVSKRGKSDRELEALFLSNLQHERHDPSPLLEPDKHDKPRNDIPSDTIVQRVKCPFIITRLQDAVARGKHDEIDLLWETASKFPVDLQNGDQDSNIADTETKKHPPTRPNTMTLSLANSFILGYMTVRQPQKAIEVWNFLVANNMTPSVLTWDAMLKGCRKARDNDALEGVWSKMISARVQPDVFCWTTRISALFTSGPVERAMKALDSMGRVWLIQAQRDGKITPEMIVTMGDINGIVKPSIETVNAAIDGVLRRRRPELARTILAWASKFGVVPDLTTYNTLLKPLIRERELDSAAALLDIMQAQGIKADVATCTTIMEETFRAAESYSPKDRLKMIDKVFGQMSARGIKPDSQTYGKLIYELLNSPRGPSMVAVHDVLARMKADSIEPTASINTMLIEHLFAQEPADLEAIRSAIQRALSSEIIVDHIFWDRVVEGFARIGQTYQAARIMRQQTNDGHKVSWNTMRTLVASLAKEQDWERAQNLIGVITAVYGGPIAADKRGIHSQHRFWEFVEALDLTNRR